MGSRRSRSWTLALALLLVTTTTIQVAWAFPGGAPSSTEICGSMNPGIGHGADPQTSTFPYAVAIAPGQVKGGSTVRIIISAPTGNHFRGFLVQLRKEGTETPLGKFSNPTKSTDGSAELAQAIKCGNSEGSAVTHTNNDDKQQVGFDWEAPNEDGKFDVLVTVLQNFGTYWVKFNAGSVTVTKSAAFVATTTRAPRTTLSPEGLEAIEDSYAGCGNSKADIPKGCFGIPGNCIDSKSCESLVTFRSDGQNGITMQLLGKAKAYVAVGLSKDRSMGDDLVFGCRKDGNRVIVQEYYNKGKQVAEGFNRGGEQNILAKTQGSEIDGHLKCQFNVNGLVATPLKTSYDVRDGKHFLLLSRGDNAGDGFLGKHAAEAKSASAASVTLTDIVKIQERSALLLQLHGSFMVGAWILCASVGMFTARYYKNTMTRSNPCGVAFWFALHRPLMALTLLLTCAGCVLIFYEVGAWTTSRDLIAEYYHPILGTIVTALTILQVLIAFCRPPPHKKFRFLFNWVHWLTGNSAYILGIACIFLASDLEKARLKDEKWFWIVLLIFVVVHVLIHIIMSVHTLKADKQMEIKNKKRAVLPGPMKLSGSDSEAPGSGFRMSFLFLYFLISGAAAAVLIYLLVIKHIL